MKHINFDQGRGKMKGLSKGFKYLSQFFDNEKEEEFEIQIGAPTDVKHVSHIGNNGPQNNAPTWMNEFDMSVEAKSITPKPNKDAPSSEPLRIKYVESKDKDSIKSSEKDIMELQKPPSTSTQFEGPTQHNSSKTKQAKKQSSDSSRSYSRENSETGRQRRHKSNSDSVMRDASERPKRNKNLSGGADYSTQDSNGPTKTKHRRKKTKSEDSTVHSIRLKGSTDSLSEHFGNLDILQSDFESKEREIEQNMTSESDNEKVENRFNNKISKEIRAL